MFTGSKYPKNQLFNFGNKFTADTYTKKLHGNAAASFACNYYVYMQGCMDNHYTSLVRKRWIAASR